MKGGGDREFDANVAHWFTFRETGGQTTTCEQSNIYGGDEFVGVLPLKFGLLCLAFV